MKWRKAAEKLPYPCTETEFGRSWAGLIVIQGKVFSGGWDSEKGWWVSHPAAKVLSPNAVTHWMNYPEAPVTSKPSDCVLCKEKFCETCKYIRGVA